MAQYLLPASELSKAAELLTRDGQVTFRWADDGPLAIDRARWWRFACSLGKAACVGCIGEHQELPEKMVVSVGLDLRRLPLLWKLPADLRLCRRLNRLLTAAGAQRLREQD